MNDGGSVLGSLHSVQDGRSAPASLAEVLFSKNGEVVVRPVPGSAVLCEFCDSVAFRVKNHAIEVIHRHHSQYHRTIVPLEELGYVFVGKT